MMNYEPIHTTATYAPWGDDKEFQEIYSIIKGHTLVDKYRCYELWKLVEQSAKLREGYLLEVGVWRGGTGALIAKQSAMMGISDTVCLCDTFSGVVKAGPKDSVYKGGEHADTVYVKAYQLVFNDLNLTNVQIHKGIFPEDTGHSLEHQLFRFVHIDVDTYQSAKDITEWVWPRMVPGGIIVYDDYGFEQCDGVTKHVNEIYNTSDATVIYNLNGHAIVVKI